GAEPPPLHFRVQGGAPRDQHGPRPVIGHELHGVAHRHGRQVRERRQPHHDAPPEGGGGVSANGRTAIFSAGNPNADSTIFGSGNVNTGRRSGPTRAGLPCRLASIALETFSGVIGVSSMRTPTASWTAFATAGITGSSGPWPASLAPNGPSGWSPSRRVGLLYSSSEGILWTPLRKTCSSISTSPRPM